jgi:hypothetical protein
MQVHYRVIKDVYLNFTQLAVLVKVPFLSRRALTRVEYSQDIIII